LTQSTNVTVNGNPLVAISGPSQVCQGTTTTLTANPAGGSGQYAFVWNTLQNTASISPSTLSAGTLNFTVTVTAANGCSAQTGKQLTVNGLPSVTINGPVVACQGATATLTANPIGGSGQGYAFVWSTGQTTASISPPTTKLGTFGFNVSVTDSNG